MRRGLIVLVWLAVRGTPLAQIAADGAGVSLSPTPTLVSSGIPSVLDWRR